MNADGAPRDGALIPEGAVVFAADAEAGTLALLRALQDGAMVFPVVSRVRQALLRAGVDCLDPCDLFDEEALAARRERLWVICEAYASWLDGLALSPAERSVLLLRCLRLATAHLQFAAVIDALGAAEGRVVRAGAIRPIAPAEFVWDETPDRLAAARRDRPRRTFFLRGWSLLPAGSVLYAHSVLAVGDGPAIRLRKSRSRLHSPFANALRTVAFRLAPGRRSLRLVPPPAPVATALEEQIARWTDPPTEAIGDAALAAALGAMTRRVALDIRRIEPSLQAFARLHGGRLAAACFNSIMATRDAALAAAMREAGVAVHQIAHGNIVVHGAGSRRAIARLMAENGYTAFPESGVLVPRSPLQLEGLIPASRRPSPAIVRNPRTLGFDAARPEPPEGRPFRILAAPNFVVWPSAAPGVAPSCFECQRTLELLARAVAGLPEFELRLRIKTTKADVAQPDRPVDRGVLPEDVRPLFALAPNIMDASAGSYRAALLAADLVVTEGLTKVPYEALEHRRPVLLLNLSSRRTPALPAARPLSIPAGPAAPALYAAGCDEDLPSVLLAIRDRHWGRALTDREIEGAVWTG